MIVVDTSVWIEAFRGRSAVKIELARLLDEDLAYLPTPVALELLGGAKKGELGQLQRVLAAVPGGSPDEATWDRAFGWVEVALRHGQRFGVMDLVIGACAAERHASIWSLDNDFARLAKLKLVKLHRPIPLGANLR